MVIKMLQTGKIKSQSIADSTSECLVAVIHDLIHTLCSEQFILQEIF